MLEAVIDATIAHCLRTPGEPRGSTKSGWVYFAQRESGGPIKIGFSRTPTARAASLGWECEAEIVLLRAVPGTMRDEKRTHALFAPLRQRGEWFRQDAILLDFIAALPVFTWP